MRNVTAWALLTLLERVAHQQQRRQRAAAAGAARAAAGVATNVPSMLAVSSKFVS